MTTRSWRNSRSILQLRFFPLRMLPPSNRRNSYTTWAVTLIYTTPGTECVTIYGRMDGMNIY